MFKNIVRSKIKYIFPLVLWIGVIFIFSSRYFSAGNTSTVLYDFIHAWFKGFSREDFWTLHGLIRKSAHVFAYAMLSYFSAVALLKKFTITRKVNLKTIGLSFLICFTIACLDEYNQSKLPSRTGTYKDVAIDMLGALLVQSYAAFRFFVKRG